MNLPKLDYLAEWLLEIAEELEDFWGSRGRSFIWDFELLGLGLGTRINGTSFERTPVRL